MQAHSSQKTRFVPSKAIENRAFQGTYPYSSFASLSRQSFQGSATSSKKLHELEIVKQLEKEIVLAKKQAASFNAQALLFEDMQSQHYGSFYSTQGVLPLEAKTSQSFDTRFLNDPYSRVANQREAHVNGPHARNSNIFEEASRTRASGLSRDDQKPSVHAKETPSETKIGVVVLTEPDERSSVRFVPPKGIVVQHERVSNFEENDQKTPNNHLGKTIQGYKTQIARMKQYLNSLEGQLLSSAELGKLSRNDDQFNESLMLSNELAAFGGFIQVPATEPRSPTSES